MSQLSTLEAKLRMGSSFTASSTLTAIGVGASFRYLFSNPSGSGKNALIYSLVAVNGGAATATGTLIANPTNNLPTGTVAAVNQDMSAPTASVCTIFADTGAAISGGISKYVIQAPSGRTDFNEEILKVPPGYSLGVSIPFAIAASCSFQMYWWEE